MATFIVNDKSQEAKRESNYDIQSSQPLGSIPTHTALSDYMMREQFVSRITIIKVKQTVKQDGNRAVVDTSRSYQ